MSNVSLVNGHIDYDELTPQEALEMLNDVEFSEKYQGKQEYTDMLLFCKEALEKQIPKKYELWNGQCSCPNCKKVFGSYAQFKTLIHWEMPYCKFCGQALDWSDAE